MNKQNKSVMKTMKSAFKYNDTTIFEKVSIFCNMIFCSEKHLFCEGTFATGEFFGCGLQHL